MNFGRTNFRNTLLILIGFALPLFPKALPILIVLLVLEWLINPELKKNFLTAIKTPLLLFFTALYFLYIAGLLYSANLSYGLADLETKLTLLLFPLLFSTPAYISARTYRSVLKAFISGNLIAFLLCFALSSYNYFYVKNNLSFFTASDFSIILHPSYFSMYINLSILIVLNEIFSSNLKSTDRKWLVFILFIFIGGVFLLSSKMGIISFLLIVILFLLSQIISHKKYLSGSVALSLLGIISVISFYNIPNLPIKFKNAVIAVTTPAKDIELESSVVRLMTWETALEIIKENPIIGVGTGDIKDELLKKYEIKGMTKALELRLNAHNQFLQTAGAIGLTGMLILLLYFIIPLYFSIINKNLISSLFVILVVLNLAVESMLETQAGVLFFAFFNSLFLFTIKKSSDDSNISVKT